MKYFIYSGWFPFINKEVYFHFGDDSQWTGWHTYFHRATIFKYDRERLFTNFVKSKAEDLGIVDIKRIEVKLGEWEDV